MKIRAIFKYLLFFGLLLLLCQCSKKYYLSTGDLKWQPYKKGDTLIFVSSENEIDTIFISNIKTYSNAKDPLDVNSTYHQSLFVDGEISLREPRKQAGRLFYREFIGIIEIYAGSEGSYLTFDLNKRSDTLRFPSTIVTLDSLNHQFNTKPKLKYNSIEIEANEYYDVPSKNIYDLKNYWWSKEYGYVRYEFKNGYYWELREFIRDYKNILK